MSNIVIIGAARSGTNMLRDMLTKIPGFATWPCDEINYIWRYGLKTVSHDEFSKDDVTPKNKRYIKKKFDWVRNKYKAGHVVEKTCANSLRVDYINELLEDVKFIFIFRDPIDVISSAEIRWKASLELDYILKKARFIPISDVPYYAFNYFKNRLIKLFDKEKRLSYWGPKYKGFEMDSKRMDAIEISAKQWEKCVLASYKSFMNMDKSKYITIEYNDFVSNPVNNLKRILTFVGEDVSEGEIIKICQNVSKNSVGKGYKKLSDMQIKKAANITENIYKNLKDELIKT
ncbi:MAG: sulfotransferase [Firmicutes bacterium]|nr:sulfotransferase [Bacillota bacterium]